MTRRPIGTRALKEGGPGPQQRHLQIAAKHFFECAEQNVYALLLDQSPNAAEERHVRSDGETEFGLQIQLVRPFAAQIVRGKGILEIRIANGLPLVIVHAVENAGEDRLAMPQKAIEARAELFGGNLSGVARTDSRDRVGVGNAGLETIHLTIEFDSERIEVIPGEICQRVMAGRKNTLVGQIMDRGADGGSGAPTR